MHNEVTLLTHKLAWAADELKTMAQGNTTKGHTMEAARLTGKAEGVLLALSYVNEMRWPA